MYDVVLRAFVGPPLLEGPRSYLKKILRKRLFVHEFRREIDQT